MTDSTRISGIETRKLVIEYLRHLTTLSTGSILVIVAFLDKLSAESRVGWLLGAALVGFLVTILSSVISYTVLLAKIEDYPDSFGTAWHRVNLFATVLVWLGFTLGIASITVFAIINFV
ncbi:hypothetical protein MYX82_06510 [Acidobacteria bacterium AH-259-D05]|nr:hypothetical protein [Acidobacteria bacterium AH-259-D05]